MSGPKCPAGHTMEKNPRIKTVDRWWCPICKTTLDTPPGYYRDQGEPPVKVLCACGCGDFFVPAYRHPGQRFKNTAHRMRAHRQRNGASA